MLGSKDSGSRYNKQYHPILKSFNNIGQRSLQGGTSREDIRQTV